MCKLDINGSLTMENNIPSSLMGYNKQAVHQILNEKNTLLKTQEGDINYLRNENHKLKKQLKINHSDLEIEKTTLFLSDFFIFLEQ